MTDLLQSGQNVLGVSLGNGWYRGRMGFHEGAAELFGSRMKLLAELRVETEDGNELVIPSDARWLCVPSPAISSGIYDGEVWDARIDLSDWSSCAGTPDGFVSAVEEVPPAGKLSERLSPPVRIIERWRNRSFLHTPKGELVIDFGQEITGWMEFDCALPAGERVVLHYGELLQDGCFYNANLRTANRNLSIFPMDTDTMCGRILHFMASAM